MIIVGLAARQEKPDPNRPLITNMTFHFTRVTVKSLRAKHKVKPFWLVPKKKHSNPEDTLSPSLLYISMFSSASHSEKLLGTEPCSVSEQQNGKLFPTWGRLPQQSPLTWPAGSESFSCCGPFSSPPGTVWHPRTSPLHAWERRPPLASTFSSRGAQWERGTSYEVSYPKYFCTSRNFELFSLLGAV